MFTQRTNFLKWNFQKWQASKVVCLAKKLLPSNARVRGAYKYTMIGRDNVNNVWGEYHTIWLETHTKSLKRYGEAAKSNLWRESMRHSPTYHPATWVKGLWAFRHSLHLTLGSRGETTTSCLSAEGHERPFYKLPHCYQVSSLPICTEESYETWIWLS